MGYLHVGNGAHCTGTLVRPRVVLTAAHCAQGLAASELRFSLSRQPGKDTAFVAVDLVRAHVGFRARGAKQVAENDVALLRLAQPVAFEGPWYEIASEWWPSGSTREGAIVVGYGFNEDGSSGYRRPRQVYVTRTVDTSPEAVLPRLLEMERGNDNDLICAGDSGGPILKYVAGKRTIVGLNSWIRWEEKDPGNRRRLFSRNRNQATCSFAVKGYATAVSAFRDWILVNALELDSGGRELASCADFVSGSPCAGLTGAVRCSEAGVASTSYCCATGFCFCNCYSPPPDRRPVLPCRDAPSGSAVRLHCEGRVLRGESARWAYLGRVPGADACRREMGKPCRGVFAADARVEEIVRLGLFTAQEREGAPRITGRIEECSFHAPADFRRRFGDSRAPDRLPASPVWSRQSCGG